MRACLLYVLYLNIWSSSSCKVANDAPVIINRRQRLLPGYFHRI